MKKTKIYANGKLYRTIYVGKTKWQVFKYKMKQFFKKVLIASFILGSIYGAFVAGNKFSTKIVYQKADAQEIIKEIDSKAPIMERIAKCESPTGQFKDGQVTLASNTNRSVDIGKYQINNHVWSKKATELGYDLMTEKGNEAMAMWIYKNKGTGAWSSSAPCWNK